MIIVWKKDQWGTNYDFTINKDRVYEALKYKINNDKFYSDVKVDDHSLDDVEQDRDCNIFNKIKIVHVEFDSKSNDILLVEPKIEEDDDNRNYTPMVIQPPNL